MFLRTLQGQAARPGTATAPTDMSWIGSTFPFLPHISAIVFSGKTLSAPRIPRSLHGSDSGMSERTMRPTMTVIAHPKAAFLKKQGRKYDRISLINVNIDISHMPGSELSLWIG